MARFLSQHMADLVRQLSFAPPPPRRRHLDNAEALYWEIDPQLNYPLDFIIFRITGYRPETTEPVIVPAAALRADLLTFVEQISATLNDKATDFPEPPIDQATLCRQLNLSTKTVSRYRRDGLFARWIDFGDGRARLGFFPASVQRFLAARAEHVTRAGRFSRMSEEDRHRIITRARRIASRVETTPFAVARHLARRMSRSIEAVRLVLVHHDEHDPRVAIFPDHVPPLTERQQRIIHRAYHRGISVTAMADRYGKARNAIYRAINRRRAAALKQLEIRYVPSPTFDLPDAAQVILMTPQSQAPSPETSQDEKPLDGSMSPTGLSGGADGVAGVTGVEGLADGLSGYVRKLYGTKPPGPEAERSLFIRYNFLKYLAAKARDKLDRHQPRAGELDTIQTHLRRAVAIKHELVRGYLRLVVSVARKHLGTGAGRSEALAELIAEGNLVLLEAVETFDAGRGTRFTTYLTWALMKRFAAANRAQTRHKAATLSATAATVGGATAPEDWPMAMNPALAGGEHARDLARALHDLLGELDERERIIITRHFGLPDGDGKAAEPQTLAQLAQQLKISAERARQIEHRAMLKLRDAARRIGLDDELDEPPTGRPGHVAS